MLLEDDISLVDGLEYALTKEGFAVTVVRTVQEALNCYKEHSFDLCILDLTLPDYMSARSVALVKPPAAPISIRSSRKEVVFRYVKKSGRIQPCR